MKDYYIYTEQMTVGYGGKPLIRNINTTCAGGRS